MSRTPMYFALVLACVAAAACGGERESPPHGASDAAPAAPGAIGSVARPVPGAPTAAGGAAAYPLVPPSSAAPPSGQAPQAGPRPGTKQDVIMLEGFSEPFTFTLFESPPDFPLSFSTYVPADVIATGDASQVTFVANFAAHRNDGVFLRILPQPAGIRESDARDALRTLASSRGSARPGGATRRFAWSLAELPYARAAVNGIAALGRHGGRYFIAQVEYPDEFAEGFGPRAAHMLQDLRWTDDGSSLTRR